MFEGTKHFPVYELHTQVFVAGGRVARLRVEVTGDELKYKGAGTGGHLQAEAHAAVLQYLAGLLLDCGTSEWDDDDDDHQEYWHFERSEVIEVDDDTDRSVRGNSDPF